MFDAKKILVAIPTLGGKTNVGLIRFLAMLERWDAPWEFAWCYFPGLSGHDYARNRIVAEFLRQPDLDAVWMIDDDMVPTEDSVRLLDVDGDIVGGAAPIWNASAPGKNPSILISGFRKNVDKPGFSSVMFDPVNPVQDVDALGMACTLIKRHVLEDRRMWGETRYLDPDGKLVDIAEDDGSETWAPPVFRFVKAPNGKQLRGEDVDFCWRAKQLGYSVRLHLGSPWGHLKTANVSDIAQLAGSIARKTGAVPARSEA